LKVFRSKICISLIISNIFFHAFSRVFLNYMKHKTKEFFLLLFLKCHFLAAMERQPPLQAIFWVLCKQTNCQEGENFQGIWQRNLSFPFLLNLFSSSRFHANLFCTNIPEESNLRVRIWQGSFRGYEKISR